MTELPLLRSSHVQQGLASAQTPSRHDSPVRQTSMQSNAAFHLQKDQQQKGVQQTASVRKAVLPLYPNMFDVFNKRVSKPSAKARLKAANAALRTAITARIGSVIARHCLDGSAQGNITMAPISAHGTGGGMGGLRVTKKLSTSTEKKLRARQEQNDLNTSHASTAVLRKKVIREAQLGGRAIICLKGLKTALARREGFRSVPFLLHRQLTDMTEAELKALTQQSLEEAAKISATVSPICNGEEEEALSTHQTMLQMLRRQELCGLCGSLASLLTVHAAACLSRFLRDSRRASDGSLHFDLDVSKSFHSSSPIEITTRASMDEWQPEDLGSRCYELFKQAEMLACRMEQLCQFPGLTGGSLESNSQKLRAAALNNLGCLYIATGRASAACFFLQKALVYELSGEFGVEEAPSTHLNLGIAQSMSGEFQRSIEHFQCALTLASNAQNRRFQRSGGVVDSEGPNKDDRDVKADKGGSKTRVSDRGSGKQVSQTRVEAVPGKGASADNENGASRLEQDSSEDEDADSDSERQEEERREEYAKMVRQAALGGIRKGMRAEGVEGAGSSSDHGLDFYPSSTSPSPPPSPTAASARPSVEPELLDRWSMVKSDEEAGLANPPPPSREGEADGDAKGAARRTVAYAAGHVQVLPQDEVRMILESVPDMVHGFKNNEGEAIRYIWDTIPIIGRAKPKKEKKPIEINCEIELQDEMGFNIKVWYVVIPWDSSVRDIIKAARKQFLLSRVYPMVLSYMESPGGETYDVETEASLHAAMSLALNAEDKRMRLTARRRKKAQMRRDDVREIEGAIDVQRCLRGHWGRSQARREKGRTARAECFRGRFFVHGLPSLCQLRNVARELVQVKGLSYRQAIGEVARQLKGRGEAELRQRVAASLAQRVLPTRGGAGQTQLEGWLKDGGETKLDELHEVRHQSGSPSRRPSTATSNKLRPVSADENHNSTSSMAEASQQERTSTTSESAAFAAESQGMLAPSKLEADMEQPSRTSTGASFGERVESPSELRMQSVGDAKQTGQRLCTPAEMEGLWGSVRLRGFDEGALIHETDIEATDLDADERTIATFGPEVHIRFFECSTRMFTRHLDLLHRCKGQFVSPVVYQQPPLWLAPPLASQASRTKDLEREQQKLQRTRRSLEQAVKRKTRVRPSSSSSSSSPSSSSSSEETAQPLTPALKEAQVLECVSRGCIAWPKPVKTMEQELARRQESGEDVTVLVECFANALQYLHLKRVCLLHLKLADLVLHSDGRWRFQDLSTACLFDFALADLPREVLDKVGESHGVEIQRGIERGELSATQNKQPAASRLMASEAIDVFLLGLFIYQALAGSSLFRSTEEARRWAVHGRGPPLVPAKYSTHPAVEFLLERVLIKSSKTRASIKETLEGFRQALARKTKLEADSAFDKDNAVAVMEALRADEITKEMHDVLKTMPARLREVLLRNRRSGF